MIDFGHIVFRAVCQIFLLPAHREVL